MFLGLEWIDAEIEQTFCQRQRPRKGRLLGGHKFGLIVDNPNGQRICGNSQVPYGQAKCPNAGVTSAFEIRGKVETMRQRHCFQNLKFFLF